jgi:uncharacterized cofD-like protein
MESLKSAAGPATDRDAALPQEIPSLPAARFVVLGGGTGLSTILRGLKEAIFPRSDPTVAKDRDRITAVVSVADDGGSTGRLRRAYRIPAPGDVRQCLVTLSDDPRLAKLFSVRFGGATDVGGHSLGNLILAALNDLEGDFHLAVERAGDLLAVRGRVVPCTTDDVTLFALYDDGSRVEGEAKIPLARRRIARLGILPRDVRATPQAREAIAAADVIVIGPGSLYTSVLPVLLVPGIAEEISRSRARVVFVMNLMTQPGETDGYGAADCVRALREHAPRVPLHDVLLSDSPIGRKAATQYALRGSVPIAFDAAELQSLGCVPRVSDLLKKGPVVRHDARKIGRALLELARGVAAEELPARRIRSLSPELVRRLVP